MSATPADEIRRRLRTRDRATGVVPAVDERLALNLFAAARRGLIDQSGSCVEQSPPSVEVVDNAWKKGENANFDLAGKLEILAPAFRRS